MGRKRKPIEMQSGNLIKEDREQRQQEEASVTVGKNQLSRAPDWLSDDIAKKEWKRIIKELGSVELIGNLDRSNLGAYCNAYSGYVRATEELQGQPLIVERVTNAGVSVTENPLIRVQRNYGNEMRRFAALCGMTIDSRLKAASAKREKEEEQIVQEFGDI